LTVDVEYNYESGIHTIDFKIEDDYRKTIKTISFTKVQPQEIKLGNGYIVKINMEEENE